MICMSLQKRSRGVSRRRARRQFKEENALKIDPYLPKFAKWKKTLLEVSTEKLNAVKRYVGMKKKIYIHTDVCIHQNSGIELKKEKRAVFCCVVLCFFFFLLLNAEGELLQPCEPADWKHDAGCTQPRCDTLARGMKAAVWRARDENSPSAGTDVNHCGGW